MFRVRISRFGDRASFKSSEVVSLFIIAMFAGMVFAGLCWLGDFFVARFFSGH